MNSTNSSAKRFLGVTVQPMYFQSEGVDAVLDSLAAAGVNAIATAPSVYEAVDRLPGDDDAGSSEELPRREPPVDAGRRFSKSRGAVAVGQRRGADQPLAFGTAEHGVLQRSQVPAFPGDRPHKQRGRPHPAGDRRSACPQHEGCTSRSRLSRCPASMTRTCQNSQTESTRDIAWSTRCRSLPMMPGPTFVRG